MTGSGGAALRVGCCGFPVARRRYYPVFQAVEIQQTFYQPPRLDTARRWRREAPEGFVFTVKAWQLVTHPPSSPTYRRLSAPVAEGAKERLGWFRPTSEVAAAWTATLEIALALEAEAVLLQCPRSFRPVPEHLEHFTAFLRSADRGGLRLVWEPRGPWPRRLVRTLCDELDLVHCVDPLVDEAVTGGVLYYRLHGLTGYRYRYTEEDLDRLARQCRGREGYVFFNNIAMFEDAQRFLARVERDAGE
ncbi:MAG: DUF72 domain-containing protein [Deferrisomatales bacterium]